ncbi:ankyrin, partial [Aspergillus ellipticus CBS 707.79]
MAGENIAEYAVRHVFLDYSAKNWTVHLRKSHTVLDSIKPRLLDICNGSTSRLFSWLNIHWKGMQGTLPEAFTPLMVASYFGLGPVASHLLQMGNIDMNTWDSTHGRSALLWAAENGYDDIVQKLRWGTPNPLKRISFQAPFWRSPLVDVQDLEGRTPLTYAAWNGHVAVAKLLLKAGARVDLKVIINETPLAYAIVTVSNGHRIVVDLLLRDRSLSLKCDTVPENLLFLAAENRHFILANFLLKKGANLEARNDRGYTPLSWMIVKLVACNAIVEFLLDKGAGIEGKGENGYSPLMMAIFRSDYLTARLLLERGAYIETRNKQNQTPLMVAISKGPTNIVDVLLERGADMEARDEENRTPLIIAVFAGEMTMTKFLFERGADIEVRDKDNRTPLLIAYSEGNMKMTGFLLERGANINVKDNEGFTLLSMAVRYEDNQEVVRLFLEKGADIHAEDNEGFTPLSWAMSMNDHTMVQILLDKG